MGSTNAAVPIPNLISGVSQQPATIRLSTAAEAMENAWPSVVTGLNKRPPTEHISKLAVSTAFGATGYLIDRDDSYQYIVTATSQGLQVFDFMGNQKTVTAPKGFSYLNSVTNPVDDIRFLTFGDTTFVLNKKVTIAENFYGEDPVKSYTPDGTVSTQADLPVGVAIGTVYFVSTEGNYYSYQSDVDGNNSTWTLTALADLVTFAGNRIDPTTYGSIFVANSVANTYYTIYFDGIRVANFLTANGADGNNIVQSTGNIASNLSIRLQKSGYKSKTYGSTVVISNMKQSTVITCVSSQGDKVLTGYRDTVASFSDLPPNEVKGRVIKVKGAPENQQDDYFVVFDGQLWIETYRYAQGTTLLPASMPHTLRRNADGSWTFDEHNWNNRTTGDSKSNPGPSFIGSKLNDMFIYSGRMGFTSDTNLILSSTGVFENYYRTTMQTLVDDDPIDMEVLSPNVDGLRHAVPFNRDLLLMSDRSQFRFTYVNYVSPKNVSVQFTTSFPCAKDVKPVNMGSSVYFVDDRSTYNFAKVFEYFPKDNLAGDDADNVTDPVPQYVKSGVKFIAASPRVKTMFVGTAGDPGALYLFKFFWNGNTKMQNAWSRWSFPGALRIHWAGFSMNRLYMIIQRSTGLYLESIRIDEEIYVPDIGSRVLLDRATTSVTKSYDATTNLTTITLPYETNGNPQLVVNTADATNRWLMPTKVSTTQYTLKGNYSAASMTAGISYNFLYEFSTPYIRFPRAGGTGELIAIDGRFQMRYLSLEYHNTIYFNVKLTYLENDPVTKEFSSVQSYGAAGFNQVTPRDGFFRVPLMGQNTGVKLTIENDSPFSSAFGGAEWYGLYSPKNRRVG